MKSLRITDLILMLKAIREDNGELEVVFKNTGYLPININKVRVEKILEQQPFGLTLSRDEYVVLSEE